MTVDLLDIDAAIDESFPTPENDTPEGDKPEEKTEEGNEKDGKDKEGDKKGEKDSQKPDKHDETDKEGDETGKKPDEKDTPSPKQKGDRVQKRFDEMTRDKYRLQRENEELRRQLDSREPDLPTKPDPHNYAFDPNIKGSYEMAKAKFERDMGKWEAKVEGIKEEHSNRTLRKVEAEQTRYYSKMANQKSVFGNFDSSKRVLHDILTPEMHDALIHESNATDLFCFFGSHPQIAEEVFSMSGYQQSREIARIAMKLRNAVEGKKPKTTKAPEPPAKAPKGGGGTPKKDPSKMTPEEWAKDQGYTT